MDALNKVSGGACLQELQQYHNHELLQQQHQNRELLQQQHQNHELSQLFAMSNLITHIVCVALTTSQKKVLCTGGTQAASWARTTRST